jgi:hypothetical protein
VCLLVLVAAVAGCAPAPIKKPIYTGPLDTGPGTLAAAREYLEGRWTLVSFDAFPPGREPVSIKATGVLVYDAYSNMSVDIRTDAATAQALIAVGLPFENGVLATNGRTVVDMNARTITYVVEGGAPIGADAGLLASNRPRHWQVDGNTLTLTTKDDSGNNLTVAVWRKES